jgi:hypothetical protein
MRDHALISSAACPNLQVTGRDLLVSLLVSGSLQPGRQAREMINISAAALLVKQNLPFFAIFPCHLSLSLAKFGTVTESLPQRGGSIIVLWL